MSCEYGVASLYSFAWPAKLVRSGPGFLNSLCSYIEALKDIHNGLNHIMHSRSLTTFYLSGLQEVIEDSLLHNIEVLVI